MGDAEIQEVTNKEGILRGVSVLTTRGNCPDVGLKKALGSIPIKSSPDDPVVQRSSIKKNCERR